MRHSTALWTLVGLAAAATIGLTTRRALTDRRAERLASDLLKAPGTLVGFEGDDPSTGSEQVLAGLPEPAQRYLRHAIASGTPLAPACRLWMTGSMTPAPGGPRTALTAVETLAPRRGFVWTAKARMRGLPVRVLDFYAKRDGGVDVAFLGIVPAAHAGGADVARSARGRLVAEAVWCPTALVHPSVQWEALDDERVRYTINVDGAPETVTLLIGPSGTLQEVTMARWGDADGTPWRRIPYGFRVDEEQAFDGVTIPSRLTGGWHYGTARFDPATAATFTVHRAVPSRFFLTKPPSPWLPLHASPPTRPGASASSSASTGADSTSSSSASAWRSSSSTARPIRPPT